MLALVEALGLDRWCSPATTWAPRRAGRRTGPAGPGAGAGPLAAAAGGRRAGADARRAARVLVPVLPPAAAGREAGRRFPGRRPRLLEHFWSHWSGPDYLPEAAELDRLAQVYGRPGAFTASINWYRAGIGHRREVAGGAAARPTASRSRRRSCGGTRPVVPAAWSDRLMEWFADVDVRRVGGVGHFIPLEAPSTVAAAILERVGAR